MTVLLAVVLVACAVGLLIRWPEKTAALEEAGTSIAWLPPASSSVVDPHSRAQSADPPTALSYPTKAPALTVESPRAEAT